MPLNQRDQVLEEKLVKLGWNGGLTLFLLRLGVVADRSKEVNIYLSNLKTPLDISDFATSILGTSYDVLYEMISKTSDMNTAQT